MKLLTASTFQIKKRKDTKNNQMLKLTVEKKFSIIASLIIY